MMHSGSRLTKLALSLAIVSSGCWWTVVPDFAAWPVETDGYVVESLPVSISASFARDNDVCLGLWSGQIIKVNDEDPTGDFVDLNSPLSAGPRMIFVSQSGVIFASALGEATYRSADNGTTWTQSLPRSVWRMSEDDLGALYAGNYERNGVPPAVLFKSTDSGATWTTVFEDYDNHHIHTVRWDDQAKRLYIAFGDGARRGQAFSDDRGITWTDLARGPHQGHTDVGFTNDYVIWASDDQSGRVFRVNRRTGATETLMGRSQFIWFIVADRQRIYVGTVTSNPQGGECAVLLASDDQGDTWTKVLETDASTGAYTQGFFGESRYLSTGGWLYCTDGIESYRIRHNPSGIVLGKRCSGGDSTQPRRECVLDRSSDPDNPARGPCPRR